MWHKSAIEKCLWCFQLLVWVLFRTIKNSPGVFPKICVWLQIKLNVFWFCESLKTYCVTRNEMYLDAPHILFEVLYKCCIWQSTKVNAFWFLNSPSSFLHNVMDFDAMHIPRLFWSKRIAGLNKQYLTWTMSILSCLSTFNLDSHSVRLKQEKAR